MKSFNSKQDLIEVFKSFSKLSYSRIFVETGLTFLNVLLKKKIL